MRKKFPAMDWRTKDITTMKFEEEIDQNVREGKGWDGKGFSYQNYVFYIFII